MGASPPPAASVIIHHDSRQFWIPTLSRLAQTQDSLIQRRSVVAGKRKRAMPRIFPAGLTPRQFNLKPSSAFSLLGTNVKRTTVPARTPARLTLDPPRLQLDAITTPHGETVCASFVDSIVQQCLFSNLDGSPQRLHSTRYPIARTTLQLSH